MCSYDGMRCLRDGFTTDLQSFARRTHGPCVHAGRGLISRQYFPEYNDVDKEGFMLIICPGGG